ncbi:SRPBCC family protein [Pigmentiphaga kullae]|uniref:Putative membrane protein n=1 Tax=Pigmentiphaga kullae TaxID=151784 RepID=A0A4Q7N8U5_9BURK|nr:SRPBCC family protein [Pigmentiphaga kullae]RZS78404.1 putative membrane protein [Pigmentiphaga kullae]
MDDRTSLPPAPSFSPAAGRDPERNLGSAERLGSAAGGSLLLLWGLRRGGLAGDLASAVAAGLLWRAATGNCPVKRAVSASPLERRIAHEQGWLSAAAATHAIVIDRPRQEIYRFWRDFSNLPRFMRHIVSIDVINDRRSRWTVKAPLGRLVEWIAHVVEDVPGERIAWEAEATADIPNHGRVEFHDAPDGAGTVVTATIAYQPPLGQAGRLLARLSRENPARQMAEDLRELKRYLEAGAAAVPPSPV